MEKIIWQSSLTSDMVQHLTPEQVKTLVQELDEACANFCLEYKIN